MAEDAPDPVEKQLLPEQRLRLSRERLRLAMLGSEPAEADQKARGAIAAALARIKAAVRGAKRTVEPPGSGSNAPRSR